MKKIRVVELFAGVGGFRLGLDAASNKKNGYETVWSSQWEPGAVTQHASEIYIKKFGNLGHSCEDVQVVVDRDIREIKDHDLLVGGFPCQDYSVARTLNQAKGLSGKKGVLWWAIHGILEKKGNKAPKFLMLENVDRLLKSPATQRGRDFAVMLTTLSDLGYAVEWRVINAAEYGMPQRRRRVFILGYRKNTKIYKDLKKSKKSEWIHRDGVIAKAFPVEQNIIDIPSSPLEGDPSHVSKEFSKKSPTKSPFENSGVMIDREIYTAKVIPKYSGKGVVLGDIIEHEESLIPEEFFVNSKDIKRWKEHKGGKSEERRSKSGFVYRYSEGSMAFPDSLEKPSRTIVTGEGGTSPSRFKHVIETKSGRLRRLMPEELEKLNMFPVGHTEEMFGGVKVSSTKRAFIMGNALVIGVIEGLGKSLAKAAEEDL